MWLELPAEPERRRTVVSNLKILKICTEKVEITRPTYLQQNDGDDDDAGRKHCPPRAERWRGATHGPELPTSWA